MRPTIRDVAQRAGVSTATVSHVLNSTRYVSDETRHIVMEAVESLGYRPNSVARSLITKATHLVGLLVADITNPFFAQFARCVETLLSQHGYQVVVCNTDEQAEREAHYLDFLYQRRVDGLIVASAGVEHSIYSQYKRDGIPMVFIDRRPPVPIGAFVGTDNVAAGYMAAEHLLALGHTQVGFIGRNVQLSTVTGRLAGFRQAFADRGLSPRDNLIKLSDSCPERALAEARALLLERPSPTAVVAANHVMALAVLEVLREQGVECPADVSLVCFDDHPWAALFTPPLTVIRMPIEAFCEHTASTLLTGMVATSTGSEAAALEDSVLPAQLVVRGSTRPLEQAVESRVGATTST